MEINVFNVKEVMVRIALMDVVKLVSQIHLIKLIFVSHARFSVIRTIIVRARIIKCQNLMFLVIVSIINAIK